MTGRAKEINYFTLYMTSFISIVGDFVVIYYILTKLSSLEFILESFKTRSVSKQQQYECNVMNLERNETD